MVHVDAMGDACPIPVVKTRNAIRDLNGPGVVETLVDNEIAVQNLTKMARHNGYEVKSEKQADNRFLVAITVGEGAAKPEEPAEESCLVKPADTRKKIVVAVSSGKMRSGNDDLGKTLLKGFLYALGQQDVLPATILFYNGGAAMTCEDSPSLEDLKSLQAQGVEILTCGTCLNFYGLTDKLKVGEVTNMYDITEHLMQADLVVKP